MIQALSEFLFDLKTVAVIIIAVTVGFLFWSVRMNIRDRRTAGKRKTKIELVNEDGSTVDLTSHVRDIEIGPESPEPPAWGQPPAWGRRIVGYPDGAATIEMETITTERDHGETREGLNTRTESAD